MRPAVLRFAALQKSGGLQDAAAVQRQQLGVAGRTVVGGVSGCQLDITGVQMKDGSACQGGD